MCGVCGQYNFLRHNPVAPSTVKAMTAAISHRGPDDEGFVFSGSLGLGFRRLSIIDLEGGHQPMSDQAGSVWVAFNGEIFNFRDLRRELETLGHTFVTQSDTEVIVHGFKQWGTGVFNRLNGMFGLAIWDERSKRLVLARDAMGIKPMYYRVEAGSVLFGSEIRAILAALPNPPAVDITALNQLLRYSYTPSPLTLYRGIRKLAPGTMAVFEDGGWNVERWYAVRPVHFSPPKTVAEAREELLDIYKRALRRHLISDVPVGLLLSGGVDSGLLLGLMNLYGEDWLTYTVGYGKTEYKDDELDDAAQTARLFAAQHSEVQLSRETFEKSLPRIVSILEEPIAASSIVPMYFVCQRARADVKVALMGQGPDELFGGYIRHLGIRYGNYWRSLPDWLTTGIGRGIGRLPRNETLKRGVESLSVEDRMERYQDVFSLMPRAAVDNLFRDDLLAEVRGVGIDDCWRELEPLMGGTDELGGFQMLEVRSSLPDKLLMYADKLSMAHGLEVRVPYLDREIVEYVERLSASYKVRHGKRKWLHREVCEEFLPATITKRKKRGFAVDAVDAWLRNSLGANIDRYLLDEDSLMFDFLEPRVIRELLADHRSGRSDNHKMLFNLVVFEEWLRSQHGHLGHVRRHGVSHAVA